MNKDANEVMMTVKEWAEKAGLKLYNYDGFTDIYSKLSGNDSGDFYTHTAGRFRDAGDLVCTRKAFESGLIQCTMQFPQMSQYDKMADVIPEFVESDINSKIAFIIGKLKHYSPEKYELRAELEDLLSLMKHKEKVREKSIKINGMDKEAKTSEIDATNFRQSEIVIIKNYDGTVEGLETKLSDEIIQSLQEMLQKQSLNLSEVPLDKIETLTLLLYSTAREKTDYKQIEEEFMYINAPNQQKESFVKTYSIIDGNGMRPGVAFDLETENGRVRGAMPTTPEIDVKIRQANGQEGVSISDIPATQDIEKSLQIIDSEVEVEDRISLKTRIKEFMRKIVDKIQGKKEGR